MSVVMSGTTQPSQGGCVCVCVVIIAALQIVASSIVIISASPVSLREAVACLHSFVIKDSIGVLHTC